MLKMPKEVEGEDTREKMTNGDRHLGGRKLEITHLFVDYLKLLNRQLYFIS